MKLFQSIKQRIKYQIPYLFKAIYAFLTYKNQYGGIYRYGYARIVYIGWKYR